MREMYGDLGEEIYMVCSQVMSDTGKDNCIILNKCIYSLVWAARQYCKKAAEILKKSWFVKGYVNTCLYIKERRKGIAYIVLCADDNLMIRDSGAISNAIAALTENGLDLEIVKSCRSTCPAVWQPHLMKHLKKSAVEFKMFAMYINFFHCKAYDWYWKYYNWKTEIVTVQSLNVAASCEALKTWHMQPGNILKQMMVQTLQHSRSCHMWLDMYWTWKVLAWS